MRMIPDDQLTIAHHWFMQWLQPNRRQAITWTNDYSVNWRIYAALAVDDLGNRHGSPRIITARKHIPW